MEWRDQGVLLSVRRHAETSAIIEVFTETHGRHLGVVRGGTSRKIAPILQPGAQIDVRWRARLAEHMGSFVVEPVKSRAALVMQDRLALAGLNAVTSLLGFCFAERDDHPRFYHQTVALLDLLGHNDVWPLAYLRWEMALLNETGFGLDLSRCAATGALDDLAFVSPKSGRAVSRNGAGTWAEKLLPLPRCMLDVGRDDLDGVAMALTTTGFFLRTRLATQLGNKDLPAARQRLVDLVARQG